MYIVSSGKELLIPTLKFVKLTIGGNECISLIQNKNLNKKNGNGIKKPKRWCCIFPNIATGYAIYIVTFFKNLLGLKKEIKNMYMYSGKFLLSTGFLYI